MTIISAKVTITYEVVNGKGESVGVISGICALPPDAVEIPEAVHFAADNATLAAQRYFDSLKACSPR